MSMIFCPKCGQQVSSLAEPCPHCGPHALMASTSPAALLSAPDETEGRKLFRAHADALASAQMNLAGRKVRMAKGRRSITKPPHQA